MATPKGRNRFVQWIGQRGALVNIKCDLCGWDKAPCDRHRIEKLKGYIKENVMILCPNCHRLATYGLL
jgi:hypothetical protein